jgi:hypothetical protein
VITGRTTVRRQWTLRVVAGCLVAVATLSGCAEKQEASTTLPSASSASAEDLPPLGPADFPVPDEARQRTEAGVVAFSNYYFDLSNHLLSTLESEPLRDLSRDCSVCDAMADSYDSDKTAGYTYEGGAIRIASTGSIRIQGSEAEISFVLTQDTLTVKDPSGTIAEAKSSLAYRLSGGMALAWDTSRSTWLVTQIDADRI